MPTPAQLSTILSARDLQFMLFEWLDVERLSERPRFADHDRDTYDALLALCEELATDRFAPHYRRSDTEEPAFDGERVHLIPEIPAALEAFAKADLLTLTLDAEMGGHQVPRVVAAACMAWFTAANIGTAAYSFLTMANAALLLAHGTPEQVDRFARPMLEGRFFGTMTLSEPHAGSSLGDVVTRAVPADDGTYRIFGNKMWISGGDHEMGDTIVHLVLAKLPDAPDGTRGISLFIVPKHLVGEDGSVGERNDVALAGINHKLGNRGTVNTAPVFGGGAFTPGGEPGAVGYLVGEPHRGLSYMFHMMNAARLGVGMSATTTAYTAYLKSLAYAKERPQGRRLAGADPTSPQVPIIEHADVRRMLLAQKSYVEGALALNLYCSRLLDLQATAQDDDERTETGRLLDLLTPIAKSWPSQWGQESNSLAIQVLGGSGYTRDYDVEAHWRDQRLNPIHEGTHGIQALDLLGRKVLGSGGASLLALAGRIERTVARATALGGEPAEHGVALKAMVDRLGEVTMALAGLGDPERTMANATVYLEAAGHVVVAWMWLEQLVAVGEQDGDFYDGKRAAARYFFRWELPKVGPMLDLLASGDTTTLDMHAGWF
ncbi:butyryl-CoA dehydrogenase [Nocardioides sp. BE266]|uniref:acyl-CoA dehydrogenase n=1 Tax=Nocardioides sp. BE266 TaxID=2817725 RepID=UPI0028678891|nr:acyl-CoA dehydrogenase [Nocardioides sp. BE266]MDR7252592.1 butyryl-CoA dehydrogenase [Nocardioides sp. BE266]